MQIALIFILLCFRSKFWSCYSIKSKPEIFLDDIELRKATQSEEVKNIGRGANFVDGISPNFLKSN